ncbi:MAG: tetratricopeptide repeat protein [Gammaproteobacteria bacterium]|nr:tetratricopeptide repeat protein [Gammaproteobacteria bacterium]
MRFLDELKKRNVIRVAALYLVVSWLVLQVADLLFDAFEAPSWAIQLLIIFLVLGFPIALLLSWVFEITEDGIVRESELDTRSVRRLNDRRVYILIGVVLAFAVAMYVATRSVVDTKPDQNTIAVLPFINISSDPDNEYFSDGLSEELLNLLAGIPELSVTARTSSFSFKNKDMDLPTIGRMLNVAHVLEGSVRKSDQQLRITAQLINVNSGFHIWSQTYDRELVDVFAIQDEIAEAVVAALRVSILGEPPRARVTQTEAFTAFLNALHFYKQRTKQGYEKAVVYARQAVAIDANYAPAWNLLSATYSNQALRRDIPYDAGHEMAMDAVEKALEIDPNYSFALSARAWIAMNYERDYAASAALFRRAVKLDPYNPVILGNRAILANRIGRTDEAIAILQQSLALDPVSTTSHTNMSDLLSRANRPNAAIDSAIKSIELAPEAPIGYINLAAAYILAEQPDKAISEVNKVDWPLYQLVIHALAYGDLGKSAESEAALSHVTERYAQTNAFQIALVHAWRGDVDTAFQWLDRAVDDGQPTNGIRNEPFLNRLHDDPRWEPLLRRLGLSDEQVAAVRF